MGTTTARRTTTVLAVLVGLFASLLLSVAATAPAEAASAARTFEVRGQVLTPGKLPRLRLKWFTRDWTYLGEKRVSGDIYTLSLAPGTYHLQFVDQRPSYDVTKYAPADVTVTIRNRSVQKDVRMRRGAAITGTVRTGGVVGKGARVVAANTYEQSYETKANDKGQFAIGGLPTGKYSVFTYDRRGTYVDKSTYVGRLKQGRAKNVGIRLRKKGGSLLVDLFRGDGSRATGKFAVTAVSKKTGQWWTATARGGKVTFRGLYPGRYTLVAPGNGDWLARTGPIAGANVRPGRADLASRFTWTKRGAWVTGRVVDGKSGQALGKVTVTLYSSGGQALATTTSGSTGLFKLSGQLTTSSNLTLQVRPGGPNPPYLTTGKLYCKFDQRNYAVARITTSRQYDARSVAIPRSASQDSDACLA
ncbi:MULTISPECIES: MSCRAMM family protein [unclassified Nocardioides]|uniref:MSCRAMM family protein n=1 Tax=unclassified Nocardioides TaxID=2615069 RepID=UPI0030156B69